MFSSGFVEIITDKSDTHISTNKVTLKANKNKKNKNFIGISWGFVADL